MTFGVGCDAEEFKALGVPFHERGRMAVSIWPRLSSCGPATRRASRVSTCRSANRVRAKTGPAASSSDLDRRRRAAALRRAAKYASGWWPFLTKPEELPAKIDFIKSQPVYDGRAFDVMYPLGMGRVGEGHVSVEILSSAVE